MYASMRHSCWRQRGSRGECTRLASQRRVPLVCCAAASRPPSPPPPPGNNGGGRGRRSSKAPQPQAPSSGKPRETLRLGGGSGARTGPPLAPEGKQQQQQELQRRRTKGQAARHSSSSSTATTSSNTTTSTQQQHHHQEAPPNALGCPHFGACPGCTLASGLERPPLADRAAAFFQRLGCPGGFDVVCGPTAGWRCRAKLAVRRCSDSGAGAGGGGGGGAGPPPPAVGLFKAGSHDAVDVPSCRTHHPRINEAADLLRRALVARGVAPYDEATGRGAIRYAQFTALPAAQPLPPDGGEDGAGSSSSGGDSSGGWAAGRAEGDPRAVVQLALVVNAAGPDDASSGAAAAAEALARALWAEAGPGAGAEGAESAAGANASGMPPPPSPPLLHSVWLNYQPARSNAIFGPRWRRVAGPAVGWQDFGGAGAAVGPGGFVQANFGAMQAALAAIAEAVPRGSRVAELYAGSGAIGLSLAAAGRASEVVCVEVNPECRAPFEAARAALPRDAAARVRLDVASAGDDPKRWLGGADVAVVDPPRRGLDAALLRALVEMGGGAGGSGADGGDRGAGSAAAAGGGAASAPGATATGAAPSQHASSSSSSSPSSSSSGGHHRRHRHASPRRLVYLSCGYAALERDAAALAAAGWRPAAARAFVFFPGSDHLETLAVFDR